MQNPLTALPLTLALACLIAACTFAYKLSDESWRTRLAVYFPIFNFLTIALNLILPRPFSHLCIQLNPPFAIAIGFFGPIRRSLLAFSKIPQLSIELVVIFGVPALSTALWIATGLVLGKLMDNHRRHDE